MKQYNRHPMLGGGRRKKTKKNVFCHLRITDALDKQSHKSHTCRRIHPPSEIGTYDLKKLYKATKWSIHSISVTEVLERPFSSDRTPSHDTLLPSLESNQRSNDLAFTFFPPYLPCSKWWKRRENKGWYHRRRPWKCQAQGIWPALIHPLIPQQIWFFPKPSREALCASVSWAGMNSSAVNLRGKRVCATCWPSTLLQPPEHQDLLTKRWMKLSLSGLYENVFWVCVKSLSALRQGGRGGQTSGCATQWFRGNWWRTSVPRHVTKRRPNWKKGGTRRKYSKR